MTESERLLKGEDRERFLDLLINQSKDGVIVIDEEGVVRFANPAAEEMFFSQAKDLIGYQIGMPAIEDEVELQIPRKGEMRHIEMRVSELSWKGEAAVLAMLRDISARKKAQQALERHKNLLQETGQMARVGGWEIDFKNNTVWWSQVTRDIHAVPEDYQPTLEEAIQFFPEDVRPRLQEAIRRAREDLEPYDMELPFINADGDRLWVRTIGRAEEQANGRARVHGTFQDITERKRAQKRLEESEQKYRTLYETMAQGVVYQNAEGEIISANPAAEHILGLTLDQMQGKTSMDPDWQAVTLDGDPLPGEQHPGMVALRTGEKVENYVFGVYQPDRDDRVWISVSAVPQFREDEEEPYQVFSTFLDITERVEAEQQLQERVKELRCIASVGEMIQRDPPLEKVGQNTVDLLIPSMQYPAIAVPVVEINGERFESDRYHEGLTHKLQAKIRSGDNEFGHATVYYAEEEPFLLPEEQNLLNQIAEMLGLWYEQKRAQNELQFQAQLLDAVGQAVIATDEQGEIIYWNRAAGELFGWPAEEVHGEYILDVTTPESVREKAEEIISTTLRGEEWSGEIELQRRDGTTFPAIITDTPMLDEEGELEGIIGVTTDITQRVEAEQALLRSERWFRALIENAMDMITVMDREGTIKYNSPSVQHVLGYTPDERQGSDAFDYVHPDDLPELRDFFRENVDEYGVSHRLKFRMKHKDGSWRMVETVSRNALHDPHVEGFVVNSRDITERHKNERIIERQVEQLSIQHEVASMGVELTDQDTVIARTTDLIARAFTHDNCGILLLDEERGHLKHHPSYRIDEKYRPMVARIGEGVIGTVAETGKPRNIPDVRESDMYREIDPQVRSELCVPIQSEERLWGVLNIESGEIEAFSPEDEQLLVTVAHQLATVLSRIGSVRAAQRRLGRLQVLRDIDQAISGSLDLKTTLNVMTDHILRNLEVDACSVLLYQPQLQTLEYEIGKGFRSERIPEATLRLGEGFAGKAALQREMIAVSDLEQKTVRTDYIKLVREEDFEEYIGLPLIAKGEIIGVLEIFHRSELDATTEWTSFLKTLAGQAAIAIDRLDLFNELQRANIDLKKAYNDVIEGWARALELRDQETEGHSRRVERMTLDIARRMGVQGDKLRYIRQGTLLHDIGKMGVPDHILQKPGKLNEEEWEVMKQHPTFAYNMLSPIDHLRPALDIPYCHHEKWDGSGYPQGLEGEEIPLAARIFAVVDVWDALRSDRPYRDAWSDDRAVSYIKDESGTHFDPDVVGVFLDVIGGN